MILTGDFNVTPESVVYQSVINFKGCGAPLADVTADVGPTFHGYKPEKKGSKIDYIFTDAPALPENAYAVSEGAIDGIYVSDHDPLFAEIEV